MHPKIAADEQEPRPDLHRHPVQHRDQVRGTEPPPARDRLAASSAALVNSTIPGTSANQARG